MLGQSGGVGEEAWRGRAERQDGAVGRAQLLAMGLTPRQARRHVDNGRWQVAWPGVYVTHSGPISEATLVWAAVLYCGDGALAGGRTALWLARAFTRCPAPLEICVPESRLVRVRTGITVHRVRDLASRGHPAANPPRVRIEHAVLDVANRENRPEAVCDVVLRVLQQRLSTAQRMATCLASRSRHRWRALITELLAESADGVHSPLERRYLRDVERPHGLPRAARNRPERDADGRRRYRDVRYEPWRLIVELDGREAHPVDEAFRDLRRDNAVVLSGEGVLHYGWRDVTGRACLVAAQVALALRDRGWNGQIRRCGASCQIA